MVTAIGGRGTKRWRVGNTGAMGQAFCLAMIGLLGVLSVFEIVRYRRIQTDPDAVSYPRRRLSRRLAVALLFIVLLLMVQTWPKAGSPWLQLGFGVLLLFLMLVGVALLLRDLHETSRAVVDLSAQLDRRTSSELQSILKPHQRTASEDGGPADEEADEGADPKSEGWRD